MIRRAAARLEARGANPLLPWGDSTPPSNSMLGNNVAGMSVNQQSATQIAAVYGCVSLLADSVSSLPIRLMSGPDPATSKELPPSQLLINPFSECSLIDWIVQFIWSLALRGNFYGTIIERDKQLYPTQIKPWHPDQVQVRRGYNGELEYRFSGTKVPLDDVFHVRYQTQPGQVIGLNPIQVCALQFGVALALDRYAESFFANSATPTGVIKVEGPLDDTETQALLRKWLSAHQGLNQSNLPAVLTDGADFKPITISPGDSQLLEALGFNEQRICGRIFRCPPHMVGIVDRSTSWGRGIEQQERGFFTNTLVGYLTRAAFSLTSLHPPGQYVWFDTKARLRGDSLQRAQAGSLMMLAGAWCADDVRETFDMAPVPGGKGKNFYVPINTELFQMAMAQLKALQDGDTGAGEGEGQGVPSEPDVGARAESNGHVPQSPFAQHIHLEPRITVNQPEMKPRFEMPAPHIHVAAPEVNVTAPEVNVAPAAVHVDVAAPEAPNVHVDVAAADVHVEPRFDVPAPEVNVTVPPAEVRIEPRFEVPSAPPPTVIVQREERKPVRRVVQRDDHNRITGVLEIPEDE